MNVYQLRPDFDYRLIVDVDIDATDAFLRWTADTDQKEYAAWKPVAFRDVSPSSEGYTGEHPLGDFVALPHGFSLAPPAMRSVGAVIARYGVLLPIDYKDLRLYWFHCTFEIDAMDEKHTLGRRMDDGFYVGIDRLAFRAEPLRDAVLFRVPQRGAGLGGPFCTDTLKHLVEDRGLRGLHFVLTWSDEPEGMARIMAREKANGYKLPPM